jgi:hypothetical protein
VTCDSANGITADRIERIHPAGRAFRFILDEECRSDQITRVGHIAGPSAFFQTPDLLGGLDLKEILFADQFLRLSPGFDEVWDRDADQQSKDCNYDQNFHKGKARPWICLEPGNFHKVLKRFVFLAKQACAFRSQACLQEEQAYGVFVLIVSV